MNRRGLVLLLFVVGSGLGIFLGTRESSLQLTQAVRVPTSMSSAAPYGNNSFIFSNGRYFASYNYVTGESQRLSPDESIDGLSDVDRLLVSGDLKYIAFELPITPLGSALYAQLSQTGRDPSQPSWWLYDITNQKFYPFPEDTRSVVFSDTLVYSFNVNNGMASITMYQPNNLRTISTLSVPSATSFFKTTNGYVLNMPDSTVLSTKDGVVSHQLFTATSVIGVGGPGTLGVGVVGTKDGSNLGRFSFNGSSEKTVARNVGPPVVWNGGGLVLFSTSDGKSIHLYSLKNQKMVHIGVPKQLGSVTPVNALNDHTILIKNSGGLELVGSNLQSAQLLPRNYDKTITVNGSLVEVTYYPSENAFLVNLGSDAVLAEQAAVYNALRADGLNPDLLDIRFTVLQASHAIQ